MSLRISEIYESVQGEGPRVGIPTIFVRFAGCNLRCSSWPCDTPHAIFPEQYRQEWETITVEEVHDRIKVAAGSNRVNICYTGGEPFLQNNSELEKLTTLLMGTFDGTIECFSNGTLPYPDWALGQVYFVMDWKLPGSGENTDHPTRLQNIEKMTFDAIKFTIADEDDYEIAKAHYYKNLADKDDLEIFYGVVWGKMENKDLIELVLADRLPWRHTMQVHNIIWDRSERGI